MFIIKADWILPALTLVMKGAMAAINKIRVYADKI